MKGKTKIISLAIALVICSVAILTCSMYALAELPVEETSYDRGDFVDESLLVSDDTPDEQEIVENEPAADVEDEAAGEPVEETPAEKQLVANWDVFSHRIQTWYGGYDFVSNSGKVYTLPAEIAETYGTTVEYELPPILIYESIGELDSTETLEVYYVRADGSKKSELITIEIPAGEAVYYVLEEEDGWVCTGFGIRAGSYGNLYTEIVEQ